MWAAYSEVMRIRSGGGSSASSSGLPAIMGSHAAAATNSSTRIRFILGSSLTFGFMAPMAGPAAAMTAGNRRRCRPPTTISANGTMRSDECSGRYCLTDRAARWHYAALASSAWVTTSAPRKRSLHRCGHGARQLRSTRTFWTGCGAGGRTPLINRHTQPGSRQHGMKLLFAGLAVLMLCNLCSICCCGGRGGFYIC